MSNLTSADLVLFSAEQIRFHELQKALGYFTTPVNAVEATVNLTIGALPTAGDTFTIGSKLYTFVTNATADADGEVNVGTDKASAQVNVKAAINGTDGYNVAHADVVCGTLAGDVYPITAKVAGVVGNAIASVSDFTSGSNLFSHPHLAAGVDGTIGIEGQQMVDASYLYVCTVDNTTADKNWRRVALGSAY